MGLAPVYCSSKTIQVHFLGWITCSVHGWLVVSNPLKNMKINGKDDNPYILENKSHVPNHQPLLSDGFLRTRMVRSSRHPLKSPWKKSLGLSGSGELVQGLPQNWWEKTWFPSDVRMYNQNLQNNLFPMDPNTVWEGTQPPKSYPKHFLRRYLDP